MSPAFSSLTLQSCVLRPDPSVEEGPGGCGRDGDGAEKWIAAPLSFKCTYSFCPHPPPLPHPQRHPYAPTPTPPQRLRYGQQLRGCGRV